MVGRYEEEGSIIIFVDKQEHADGLLKDLMNASYTSCSSLHGGIDQYDRDSTIAMFKKGDQDPSWRSVCARGLDVKNLIQVVNYDCPNHYEDYVHGVGRTGRAVTQGTPTQLLLNKTGTAMIKRWSCQTPCASGTKRPYCVQRGWRVKEKKVRTGGGFGGTGLQV